MEFYEQYVQPGSDRRIEAKNWDIHDDSINILFERPDDLDFSDRMVTRRVYAKNKTINPSIPDTFNGTSQREIVPLASYIIPNKAVPGFQ